MVFLLEFRKMKPQHIDLVLKYDTMISNTKYWEVKRWVLCTNQAKIISLREHIRKWGREADRFRILEPFILILAIGCRRHRKTVTSGKRNNFR